MRTTLTLDEDVAVLLREEMDRSRLPMKQVVNRALRRGLQSGTGAGDRPRFETKPHAFGLRPGIDPNRLSDVLDDLEAEEFRQRMLQER